MSWLISILLAGAMFAPDGNSPARLNTSGAGENIKNSGGIDESERFEQTYPLDPTGRVSVSNVNGSITIDTWDNPQVKLEYVKTADIRERLSEVEIRIDARPDLIRVETEYDNGKRANGRQSNKNGRLVVEYRLTVPRTAVLDEIETVNGSINIANAANMTKAAAVNGEIRATNLRGTANLSTVNGTVRADFDRLQTGSRILLDTVNGTVNLTIPSDADATVKADTVNGSITNDFGLPVRKGQYVGKNLYGRIGTGDVQIKLASVNGGLSIKRKNDGKNTNPATNLLPPKSKTDDDSGSEGEARINTGKLNREIERANAEAQREIQRNTAQINKETARVLAGSTAEIERAMEIAKNEIANIDVEKITADALRSANFANYFGGAPNVEKRGGSFVVKGIPKVTIEAEGCSVVVRGWDKSEVAYSIVKITESNNDSTLNISATNNVSDVSIKVTNVDNTADRGNFYGESNRVRVEIFVPKKSDLKIDGDGEIRLEGVTGAIDLQGADETINVRDAGGKLSVGTADGTVRVIGFRGAFDGKTADGAMNLEGDFTSFNALAADGTIILTLPENADALLEANAEIENDGVNMVREAGDKKAWRVGKGGVIYRMSVENGKIIVRNANSMKIN
ncbi:MAG TPA: DUF4097 family beta strand repeat-containing protein [Pyrinomonadaceae bacterium]|nr:DUF4097 family beta strand repeat-containing protein [Pyrinomonadaceae bacterium]